MSGPGVGRGSDERTTAPRDPSGPRPSVDTWVGGAVALLSGIGFGTRVALRATVLDSAELAAASFGLGVAHPPGEPVALLWGRLWAGVPLGGIAWRVGLSQAVAAAVACALVFALTVRALPPVHRWAGRALAAGAGLLFAAAPGVAINAVRPEVYALATALALGAVALADHARLASSRTAVLGAAGLVGLGLVVHPLVAGLTALAAVALVLPLWWRGPRLRLAVATVGVWAASLAPGVIYLVVRSRALLEAGAADAVSWGDARTLRGLWWILTARTFAAKAAVVHHDADPGALPFLFIEELGLPVILCALLGAYVGLRTRARLPMALLLLLGGSAGAALVGGVDPTNPDIRGYLGPALAAVAALAAVGVGAALSRASAPVQVVGGVATVLAALAALVRQPPPPFAHERAAELVATQRLAALPPRAVLLTGHFETAFLTSYARTVEGWRPDVDWLHLGFSRSPGYAERVARGQPKLAAVALVPHQLAAFDVRAFTDLARDRPVAFEPQGDFAPAVWPQAWPRGLAWRWSGPTALLPSASEPLWPAWLDAVARREAAESPLLRAHLSFLWFQDAAAACRARRADAPARVRALREWLPDDRAARALEASCL